MPSFVGRMERTMRVSVISNTTKDFMFVQTARICEILHANGAVVYLGTDYEGLTTSAQYTDNLYTDADAVIVLGGDGTILREAVTCAKMNIPVMGINLGRVGFMTETELDDVEENIKRLISGDYEIQERMMMCVEIVNKSEINRYLALNDCVVSKPDAQMINVSVFADNEKITEYIADGAIISTPTGSTGYSLSAGGPVADPACEMFLATPVCAHTLLARPAVMSAEKEIAVTLFEGANKFADVTVDGVVVGRLEIGDSAVIKKADEKFRLIKFKKQSFYDIMTAKLV